VKVKTDINLRFTLNLNINGTDGHNTSMKGLPPFLDSAGRLIETNKQSKQSRKTKETVFEKLTKIIIRH